MNRSQCELARTVSTIVQILFYTTGTLVNFCIRESVYSHDIRGKVKLDLTRHRLSTLGNSYNIENSLAFFVNYTIKP